MRPRGRPPASAETHDSAFMLCTSPPQARRRWRWWAAIEPTIAVILSDINMPGMDGLRLLGEIKQRSPKLIVIRVTAYGDGESRRRDRERGAFEFITKRSITTY